MSQPSKDNLLGRRERILIAMLRPTEKLYLHTVLKNTDKGGFYYPSVAYIAQNSSLSESTVYRIQHRLEALGIIEDCGFQQKTRVKRRRVRFDRLAGSSNAEPHHYAPSACQSDEETLELNDLLDATLSSCESNSVSVTVLHSHDDIQTGQGQANENHNMQRRESERVNVPDSAQFVVVFDLLAKAGVKEPNLSRLARSYGELRVRTVIASKPAEARGGWVVNALDKNWDLPETDATRKLVKQQKKYQLEREDAEAVQIYESLPESKRKKICDDIRNWAPGNNDLLAAIGTEREASRIGPAAFRMYRKRGESFRKPETDNPENVFRYQPKERR